MMASYRVIVSLIIFIIMGNAISVSSNQRALAQPVPPEKGMQFSCPPGKVPSQLIKGPPCLPYNIKYPVTRGLILFCTEPLPVFGEPKPPRQNAIGLRYFGLPNDRAILVEVDRGGTVVSQSYGSTSATGSGELRHRDFDTGEVLHIPILTSMDPPGDITIRIFVYEPGIHYDPLIQNNPDLRSQTPTLIMTMPFTITMSTYTSLCQGGNSITLASK
jgi:hypothetical protein